MFLNDVILMLLSFLADGDHHGTCFENHHDGETDAEDNGEELGMHRMGEKVNGKNYEMDEEGCNSGGQKDLDKASRRLIHALQYNVVLRTGYHSEIECQHGHDRQKSLWGGPHDHERSHCQY